MRSTKTLAIALATTALALSACSKSSDEAASATDAAAENAAGAAADAASTSAGSMPDIGLSPGVAFQYAYAFTLPAKAISGVQQQHAASCQRLGSARCRVTGMTYEQPGEDDVSARMDFLLAPDIAHSFGSDAVGAVEKANGKLDQASVNGEDAGSAIILSQQNSAAIQAEVERIEVRLKAGGLSSGERTELTRRAEELRQQLNGEVQTRRDKEKSLATTPVSFSYASQGVIGSSGAFGKAASASWLGLATMTSVLVLLLGYALPWLLPIGAGVLLWRYRKAKRLLSETAAGAHSPAAPAGPASPA